MKQKQMAVLLALLVLILSGCSTQAETRVDYGPSEENQLTVYVSHKESVYLPIVREFEERTGIWVQIVSGGTNELLTRIEAEQEAPQADIMFGGGVESLEAYGTCFSPYVSRAAGSISEDYADPQSLWTPFSALPAVLIYNTKLVDPQDFHGFRDLLKPQYQGKIAYADPEISGSSYTALITALLALKDTEPQPMEAFVAALNGEILSGSGEVVRAVSEGRAYVGVTLEETAKKAIAAGDHIGIVYPEEGTSCLPDGIALIKNGMHPENARRFLDFAVSPDVQKFLTTRECRRSVRSDVPVSSDLPPLSELTILLYDADWACQSREEIMESWRQELEAVR